jgi:hypothetical protein
MNRKSISLLKYREISPLQKRYKEILQDREANRMKLGHLMEFERMLKDPENIDPPFHPNSSQGSQQRRTLTKKELKRFLMSMELWDLRKNERVQELQSRE